MHTTGLTAALAAVQLHLNQCRPQIPPAEVSEQDHAPVRSKAELRLTCHWREAPNAAHPRSSSTCMAEGRAVPPPATARHRLVPVATASTCNHAWRHDPHSKCLYMQSCMAACCRRCLAVLIHTTRHRAPFTQDRQLKSNLLFIPTRFLCRALSEVEHQCLPCMSTCHPLLPCAPTPQSHTSPLIAAASCCTASPPRTRRCAKHSADEAFQHSAQRQASNRSASLPSVPSPAPTGPERLIDPQLMMEHPYGSVRNS